METSHRAPTSTQRLLQKFPQVRRWRPRHVHSESALERSKASGHESNTLVYSLKGLPNESASDISPEQCAHIIDQALITGNNKDDHEPLVEFVSSQAPKYTPMPIPERMSSARTASRKSPRGNQVGDFNDAHSSEGCKHADDTDDVSFHLSGLEDANDRLSSPVPSREEASTRGRPRTRTPAPLSPKIAVNSKASSKAASVPHAYNNGIKRPHQAHVHGSIRTDLSGSTAKASPQQLPALQNPVADRCGVLHTEINNIDDPDSWDVIKSSQNEQLTGVYSLEDRAEQLYSSDHLSLILDDPEFRLKFSNFIRKHRPWRLPVLGYYWKSHKAIKALQYTNSLVETLRDGGPLHLPAPSHAVNAELMAVAHQAFESIRREDLHYYFAHTYIQIVSAVVQRRIQGNLAAHLRETSQGLAEVFCVTDPSRPDNPIILASQEFTRQSGCNLNYILGRNCNFLQGPGTTMDSRRRFAIACAEGRDHTEILVNYRRDGSPFLNLVMNAPLVDSRGKVRYFLGAQVDISGLLKECSGMPSLQKLVDQAESSPKANGDKPKEGSKDRLNSRNEIKALSQLFNGEELDIIRRHGGDHFQGSHDVHSTPPISGPRPRKAPRRVLIDDGGVADGFDGPTSPLSEGPGMSNSGMYNQTVGSLEGVFKHYLLVRPYPSMRVLFVSPRLRQPGMVQSHFLHHIGGAGRLRQDLEAWFSEGNAVTAKVRWLDVSSEESGGDGSTRWVHCTPLMHYEEKIGLWMVVVVFGDEEPVDVVI